MRCPNPHCINGRVVGLTGFGQGQSAPYMTQEIGPCPDCHGGTAYCCDTAGENFGDDAREVMVELTKGIPESMAVQFVWAEPDAEDLNGC